MDLETIYGNVEGRDIQNTTGPQTQSHGQDEGKDLKRSKQNITLKLTDFADVVKSGLSLTYFY